MLGKGIPAAFPTWACSAISGALVFHVFDANMHFERRMISKLDFVQKNVRVQVQKIPFVVIYTKACSMGKMFHPKSPTSCHRSR